MIKKTGVSVLLAILLCGFLPAVSCGQQITIAITAEVAGVTDKYGHLEGKIHVGDAVTGTYTYDSLTSDSNPSSTVGEYYHYSPPAGISLECGGLIFRTDPTNVDFLVSAGNNYSLGEDSYLLRSYHNLPLSNGTLVDYIEWQLDDSTGLALSSDALPLTAPNLTDWDYDWGLSITGPGCGSDYFGIVADITSVALIPEPATLLLLIFGTIICKRH
jgi:hypothetical protein